MEKENVSTQESRDFSKKEAPVTILIDGYKAGIMGGHIDHSVSLEELFRSQIKCGIDAKINTGEMMPAAFLICRDYEKEQYKIGIYPMPNPGPGAMEFHSKVLRRLVGEMKAAEKPTFKLVGIIVGMDAHFLMLDAEEVLDKEGVLDKSKYVPPRENKNSKSCLHFTLEDKFGKHSVVYEYVEGTDGKAVVSDKPMMDEKIPFNNAVNQNCNFGFMFAEPVGQN